MILLLLVLHIINVFRAKSPLPPSPLTFKIAKIILKIFNVLFFNINLYLNYKVYYGH